MRPRPNPARAHLNIIARASANRTPPGVWGAGRSESPLALAHRISTGCKWESEGRSPNLPRLLSYPRQPWGSRGLTGQKQSGLLNTKTAPRFTFSQAPLT